MNGPTPFTASRPLARGGALAWLLLAAAALVSAGSLIDLYIVFPGARKAAQVVPLEALLPIIGTAYVFRQLRQRHAPMLSAPRGWLVLAFPAWAAVSLVLAGARYRLPAHELGVSGLYLARWSAYALIFFGTCGLPAPPRRKIIRALLGGVAAFAIFGIVQAIFLPNFAFDVDPKSLPFNRPDVQGHRLVSSILDPNIAGAFLAVFCLVALALYLHGNRRWLWPGLLFATAMVMTVSRGTAAGFAVGAACLLASRGRSWVRVFLLLSLAAVAIAAMSPYLIAELHHFNKLGISDYSARTRFTDWIQALNILDHNLIYGIGFNTLAFVSPLYGLVRSGGSAFGFAGDLMLIPVMTGIVGAALYAGILATFWGACSRVMRSSSNRWDRGIASGTRAAIPCCIVCSLFTSVLLYPAIMAGLWILWAHVSCTEREAQRKQDAVPARRQRALIPGVVP